MQLWSHWWSVVRELRPACSRLRSFLWFATRDQRTLLDKMVLLLDSLGIGQPFYFVADAYYASGELGTLKL